MRARTGSKQWLLKFDRVEPREIEPLMGWTSSGDMRQQVHLRFDTLEEATAYCERHGIAYQIFHSKPPARRSSKTKALAISDPVKREAPGPSMFDSQLALFGALVIGGLVVGGAILAIGCAVFGCGWLLLRRRRRRD